MRFSVMIPVYNVEKYIEDAILSVLRQSFQSFEIVLVNDGATDASKEICEKYATEHPNRIRLVEKENGGLLSARRVGIQHAQGDYCVFLDADDILDANSLELFDRELSNDGDPDMLIYNLYYMSNEGERGAARKAVFENGRVFERTDKSQLYVQMIGNTYLNPLVLKVIKRPIIQNDPTDYSLFYDNSYGEDILQSLYPVTVAERIKYITEPLYGYRMSETSMIRHFSEENMDKRINVKLQSYFLEYMKKWDHANDEYVMLFKSKNMSVVMDDVITFLRGDPKLYCWLKRYSKDYAKKNPEIKQIIRSKSIPIRRRIQLYLFSKGYIKTLIMLRNMSRVG